jgi:hypothetical protein
MGKVSQKVEERRRVLSLSFLLVGRLKARWVTSSSIGVTRENSARDLVLGEKSICGFRGKLIWMARLKIPSGEARGRRVGADRDVAAAAAITGL